MSTQQFQASKLFGNSGASDSGWDDWDWVDNANQTQAANLNYSTPPAANQVDNHPNMFHAPTQPPQGIATTASFFNHPQQPVPHQPQVVNPQSYQEHPTMPLPTPPLSQVSLPNSNNNVNEHFSASNNNLNWSSNGPFPVTNTNAAPVFSPNQQYATHPVNPQPPQLVSEPRQVNFDNVQVQPQQYAVQDGVALQYQRPQTDDLNPSLPNPILSQIQKEHTLTPQWSTESQMSYTSSDRSISEQEPNRLFSNHSTPEDPQGISYQNNTADAAGQYGGYVHVDSYNTNGAEPLGSDPNAVSQVPTSSYQPESDDIFNQNLAPPLEFAQNEPPQSTVPVNIVPPTQSIPTLPIAELHAESHAVLPPIPTIPAANTPQNPLPPPSLTQSPYVNTNPFKRVGQHAHKPIGGPSLAEGQSNLDGVSPPLPPLPPRPLSSSPAIHQEPVVVDNPLPAIEVITNHHVLPAHNRFTNENHETVLHNDRNQYLQTGHLSEEDNGSIAIDPARSVEHQPQSFDPIDSSSDNLPPPGLSRYVPGEPEISSRAQPIDPPLGLDRMITGTEITGSSSLNLERQADGQDTSLPPRNIVHFSTPPVSQAHLDNHGLGHPPSNIEHNVPLTNSNIQRVVTGLENVSHQHTPYTEQQRELVADGENLNDENDQTRHGVQPAEREEPIEGANTLDNVTLGIQSQPLASNLTETESNDALDIGSNARKYHSNNSTGNDESDKEKPVYRGSNSRRGDERPRKRGEKQGRYETEDTDYSVNDRRKFRENRERNERGDTDRERVRNKDRRVERTERGDRDRYRDNSREREEKYERERGYRDSRYETDGSRYDPEDSRYDRSLRRRGDRDAKYRDDRGDRRYRRDRDDRTERTDRDRRTDERYRQRDDPRYSEYESGDYNYRSRGHPKGDHRRDRGAGSDREGGAIYGGYYPPQGQGFGYDAYASYIQQQQYYENLRRTNPHAYAEWYKHYFGGGQLQAAAAAAAEERTRESGRESVHSGRSSSKDPERYMFSTSHGIYNTHSLGHRISNDQFSLQHNSTMLEHNHQPKPRQFDTRSVSSISHISQTHLRHHGQSQLDSLAYIDTNAEPERMTPFKYAATHCSASIQSGIMVAIKPKYSLNDLSNVVNLLTFGPNDSTKRLYQVYPGPLFRGSTHKKRVIEFCQEQIRIGPPTGSTRSISNSMVSLQSLEHPNKTSYTLVWNLLILLLRQNGTVVGTDIAELLLKNKEEFPYEHQTGGLKIPEVDDTNRESPESDAKQSNEENNSSDGSQSDTLPLNETEITDKFRNFLLYGSVIEALDWASDNNLWGHALFLASKMDRRTHANVMMKFANKLSLSDPLQTLYQLMSGRTPLSVTCVQDEKWGDWRPHLAMIISNTSSKPDLDRKAITTLGDSLYNRGDLYAAQFCYLMAQVNFGRYSDVKQETHLMLNSSNAVRLILLGSSHRKNFKDFATDEAIIMTEIYEYACTLADENFSIVELQPYKFLLGTRMLDYGLHMKALLYMEQIAVNIQKNPTKYERTFIERVYNLADKLKYYDPALEKNIDDLAEDDGSNSLNNNSSNQQQWQQDLLNILGQTQQPTYDTIPTASNAYPGQNQTQYMQSINDEFSHLSQQVSDLTLQYNNVNYYGEQSISTATSNVVPEPSQAPLDPYSNHFYHQPPNQYHEENQQPNYGQTSVDNSSYNGIPYGEQPHQHQQPLYQPGPVGGENLQETSPYDQYEAPKPTISMPNSMSNKPGFYDDGDQPKSAPASGQTKSNQDDKKKTAVKSGADGNQSGWFGIGGIWNKLSMKPKNQMILPDDKNPAIVWDPDNKKWVNTDADAPEEEVFKPPPKMPNFNQAIQPNLVAPVPMPVVTPSPALAPSPMPQIGLPSGDYNTNPYGGNSVPTSDVPGNNNNDPAKVPNLQSNMFKMQRNKTLKKSYVDVFNPSGAPAKPIEPILAPTVPMVTPQTGFFVPAPVASNDQKQDEPLFYNPNQFAGGYQQ